MALDVFRGVLAQAPWLVFRLGHDVRAGPARDLAMGVHVVDEHEVARINVPGATPRRVVRHSTDRAGRPRPSAPRGAGDHVAAGHPEGAGVLIGGLEDAKGTLSERLSLAARLEDRSSRDREGMVSALDLQVLAR